jgi:hypothetical protein
VLALFVLKPMRAAYTNRAAAADLASASLRSRPAT